MKKIVLFVIGLTACMLVHAENILDIYGANPEQSSEILKKYSKEINKIETSIVHSMSKETQRERNSSKFDKIVKKRYDILQQITKDYGFLFVDIQTVLYPDTKVSYTTMEIIDQKHPERLRFVSHKPMTDGYQTPKKAHKPDLIDSMIVYSDKGLSALLRHKITPPKVCPVYHCVVGFEHPTLKPYLKEFNTGAIQQRALILDTLNHDPDPKRRGAAAFLVGHFKDPRDILKTLSPHVDDQDDGVRNDVMRVMVMTLMKAKINDIDATPFLAALDSPYSTDRNKALMILTTLASSNAAKKVILEKGSDKLLTLIQLKQPNNSESAYLVLKKMSGKNYAVTNVAAWKKWVSLAKKNCLMKYG